MKKLIAGNWKMNGTRDDAKRLIADIVNGIHVKPELLERCEFLVFPPYLYIGAIRHSLTGITTVAFGAQDCSSYDNGAYTGDISAAMLKEGRCSHVILGHSERRQHHEETNEEVAQKAQKAHQEGLITIICVGETEGQREKGQQDSIVAAQLKASLPASATAENTIIAYEPVWAIGTGKTATPEMAQQVHAALRAELAALFGPAGSAMRIQYGGSVKPDNTAELMAQPDIDGALVGGASLDAKSFAAIVSAAGGAR